MPSPCNKVRCTKEVSPWAKEQITAIVLAIITGYIHLLQINKRKEVINVAEIRSKRA